jgi:hypothetical protein
MTLWLEMSTAFLVYVIVGSVFVLLYLALQWFFQATDVTVSYDWSRDDSVCHANFKVINRSAKRTYSLANIAYSNGKDRLVWFDNKSLMGKVLKPRSITEFRDVAPVKNCASISECMQLRVTVRLQSGRKLWLRDQKQRQFITAKLQRISCELRNFIEKQMTAEESPTT